MSSFTCQDCGQGFQVAPATLERFPGWTPRVCLRCRDQARAPREGAAAAAPARRPPRPGRSVTASRELTPEEVLERFHEGPDTGVFTDGSSVPNPGPGGWGAVWVEDGVIRAQEAGSHPDTTNNRMELTALIHAFRMLPPGRAATVFTDSELCVNTVTKWAASWERNGWKRKTGPIQNLDLVQELFALARARPEVELKWAPAHSGWRWNEYADALANARRHHDLG